MIPPLESVPDRIAALAEEGRLTGRSWTLAGIAEHLARTMEWQLGKVTEEELASPLLPAVLRPVARVIFLSIGRLPRNVRTIERLVAPADVTLPEALRHLRDAIERVQSCPEPYPPHPVFGNLTRAQWLRFHAVHAHHHLRIVS